MQNNFLPLTEIQKMLIFSPIKTYRLFVKFKQAGRLREEQDWIIRDQNLFLDLPRFYTELEADGYQNVLQDDYKSFQMNSFENTRDKVISTENSSLENSHGKAAEKITSEEPDLKSKENIRSDLKTNENEIKQVDYKLISSEIMQAKDEIIGVLKDSLRQTNEQLTRSERDKEHYRKEMDYISQQNQRLTHLTYLLTAPKQRPATSEAARDRAYATGEPAGERREEAATPEPEVRVADVDYAEPTGAETRSEEEPLPGQDIYEEEPGHVEPLSL